MAEKVIGRVMDAVNDGFKTSAVIASIVGISPAAASAHLCELAKCGLVKRSGVADKAKGARRGRDAYRWTPTTTVSA